VQQFAWIIFLSEACRERLVQKEAFVCGTLPTKKRLIFSSNENKKSPSLGHA